MQLCDITIPPICYTELTQCFLLGCDIKMLHCDTQMPHLHITILHSTLPLYCIVSWWSSVPPDYSNIKSQCSNVASEFCMVPTQCSTQNTLFHLPWASSVLCFVKSSQQWPSQWCTMTSQCFSFTRQCFLAVTIINCDVMATLSRMCFPALGGATENTRGQD